MDSRRSANISPTIHITKVPRQLDMHVHDVAGQSVVYYTHHEGTQCIARPFHVENNRAPSISQMWNVKFRIGLDIYYPHL